MDVVNQSSIDRLRETIKQRYGKLDVAVNNAAISTTLWSELLPDDGPTGGSSVTAKRFQEIYLRMKSNEMTNGKSWK